MPTVTPLTKNRAILTDAWMPPAQASRVHVLCLVNCRRARTVKDQDVNPSRFQPVPSRKAGKGALLLMDYEAQILCSCVFRYPPCKGADQLSTVKRQG